MRGVTSPAGTQIGFSEQPQGKEDERPAEGRLRIGEDPEVAVVADQRPALDHGISAQVLCAQVAAAVGAVAGQLHTPVAVVEQVRACLGQGFQAAGQVRLAQGLARCRQLAGMSRGCVWGEGCLAGPQDGLDNGGDMVLEMIQRDAVAGIADGRSDQLSHGQPAEIAVHREHPGDDAGGRNGSQADVELLGCVAEIDDRRVKVRLGLRALLSRSLGEEVVEQRSACGGFGQEKAAASKGRQHRLGDTGGAQGGDGAIEGIAPGLHDEACGLGGFFVACGDNAVTCDHVLVFVNCVAKKTAVCWWGSRAPVYT